MTAQAQPTIITADDIAERLKGSLDSKIEGWLDEKVGDAVKTVLQRLEGEPQFSGVTTPDGGTKDKKIKNFPDFLLAIARKDVKRLEEHYKSTNTKALNEGDGSEAGYTVPEEFEPRLLEVAGAVNPIDALSGSRAPMAMPMSSRTLTMPALDQTITPGAGTSAFDAGVAAAWTAESGAIPETTPTFSPLTLTAHKLSGHTIASNELEQDSAIALGNLLTRLFGQAIGRRRLHACLRGDGVGKPLGVLNAPAAIPVNRTGSGNNFDAADVPLMARRLFPGSLTNAVWFIHPFLLSDMTSMAFGSNSLITWANIEKGIPGLLFGMPYFPVEFASAPGTAGDVFLVDWSYYLIGNRGGTTIAVSDHVRFLNDDRVWRFTHRVDGQPWTRGPTILSDGAGTNTVSAFTYLN
jgi:HK97 family phage major capsid protein